MKKVDRRRRLVITTAQVFGRPAPLIVTRDMVEGMRPGSVVVDMAVESGGNVEGSVVNEVIDIVGVRIVGLGTAVARQPQCKRDVLDNVVGLLDEFWDKDAKELRLDPATTS